MTVSFKSVSTDPTAQQSSGVRWSQLNSSVPDRSRVCRNLLNGNIVVGLLLVVIPVVVMPVVLVVVLLPATVLLPLLLLLLLLLLLSLDLVAVLVVLAVVQVVVLLEGMVQVVVLLAIVDPVDACVEAVCVTPDVSLHCTMFVVAVTRYQKHMPSCFRLQADHFRGFKRGLSRKIRKTVVAAVDW